MEGPGIEWVIENPPYKQFVPILERALHWSDNVAFFLRITALEPCQNRAELLEEHQDHLRAAYFFGSPRPGREFGGTDFTTRVWLVWDREWSWRSLGHKIPPFNFISRWKEGPDAT